MQIISAFTRIPTMDIHTHQMHLPLAPHQSHQLISLQYGISGNHIKSRFLVLVVPRLLVLVLVVPLPSPLIARRYSTPELSAAPRSINAVHEILLNFWIVMGGGNYTVDTRYVYTHNQECLTTRVIDTHHIEVRRSGAKVVAALCLFTVLASAYAFYIFFSKDRSNALAFWGLPLCAFIIMKFNSNTVKKESVLILPSFGVQLETRYRSGRIVRRFVPIGKLLKPVLQECVTPITCYWCLSLVLREEDELMLVFKELRPPLKMLIPVWKALCAPTDGSGGGGGGGSEECPPNG
ncbi:hypothetical protein SAY86_028056 [Trapa natans]|uniref:Phosphatidylinositol N-acetylglucosaminyltransferase subunit H conserved domain-containing protein n=1 Tax=Trapa natans TaxID=22666 RepID=A0AAN7MEY2_TRANT|nr:hypothetical protein SAY86_028056 [Trapa natans]